MFAEQEAIPLFNQLCDEERELAPSDMSYRPDVDVVRDAPVPLARFGLMREMPLAAWTTIEFTTFAGVRRQRRRAVLERRQLPSVPPSILSGDRSLETWLMSGRSFGGTRPFRGDGGGLFDLVAQFLSPDPPRHVAATALAEERERLLVFGLFAIEALCMCAVDRTTEEEALTAWRKHWMALDAEFTPEALAQCSQRPPHVPVATAEALALAVQARKAELPKPLFRGAGGSKI